MQFISLINSLHKLFISEGRGKRYLFQREGKIADCGLLPNVLCLSLKPCLWVKGLDTPLQDCLLESKSSS